MRGEAHGFASPPRGGFAFLENACMVAERQPSRKGDPNELRRTPYARSSENTLLGSRVNSPYERRHPTTSGAPFTSKQISGGST